MKCNKRGTKRKILRVLALCKSYIGIIEAELRQGLLEARKGRLERRQMLVGV